METGLIHKNLFNVEVAGSGRSRSYSRCQKWLFLMRVVRHYLPLYTQSWWMLKASAVPNRGDVYVLDAILRGLGPHCSSQQVPKEGNKVRICAVDKTLQS